VEQGGELICKGLKSMWRQVCSLRGTEDLLILYKTRDKCCL
jgi:hypothetical protein